jgi:ATP-dependent Lon protease
VIDISNEALGYIVESFTYEAGVRDLKRKIEKIILKLNKDRIYKNGIFAKGKVKSHCLITKEIVDKYLTKPNILVKKVHTTNEVGVVNGLYATTSGMGGIIPILVYKHHMGKHGKFILKLTGKQGVVMKESVFYAFTIATNLIKNQYCDKFFNTYQSGLHIHTPDGATSKDGPSAGGAFLLAFISKILNKKIKHNVGMTGEIEINGNITAIGGLEYKLDGAKRAGINLVFVPKENEHDIEKIGLTNKTLFSDTFKYQLVDHISQIADMALLEDTADLTHDATYQKTFDSTKYLELHASAEQNDKVNIKKPISDDSDDETENENSENDESTETESDTDSDMEYD